MQENISSGFVSSLLLDTHPMKNVKKDNKAKYYFVLEHFCRRQQMDCYSEARLRQYHSFFIKHPDRIQPENYGSDTSEIVRNAFGTWRKKYKYYLICDIALIFLDDSIFDKAVEDICTYMTDKQRKRLQELFVALKDENSNISSVSFAQSLISQYHKNKNFINQPIKKYAVTANTSAGKSTFINALIGKPISRMSVEACTGNICCFYSKAFEDGHIHLENSLLSLNAGPEELSSFSWDTNTNIASCFRQIGNEKERICIVDTPGVNSAIYKQHGEITRSALLKDDYDKLIYILNATKLGTEEEIAYLKWIAENISHEKIVFVLNKLDTFNITDDNIAASIDGVHNDLTKLGFDNPTVCPLSARFSLLLKMKMAGDELSDDELDEYYYFSKKFKKQQYDLSKYYNADFINSDDEVVLLSQKCGLYGLENLLLGGK